MLTLPRFEWVRPATLEALLAWDVIPIVNENDSTATDEITFGDNDALAAQVGRASCRERVLTGV